MLLCELSECDVMIQVLSQVSFLLVLILNSLGVNNTKTSYSPLHRIGAIPKEKGSYYSRFFVIMHGSYDG